MQINPVFNDFEYDYRKCLCKAQSVVESKLIPPHGVTLAKVLSITADAKCGVAEVFTGESRFNGRVTFRVLFVDGDGKNHFMENCVDFSDKIECSLITSDTKPFLNASVLDTEVISVSGGEIKLASVVEIALYSDEKAKVTCLSPQSEGVYTRLNSTPFCSLVARATATSTVENSVETNMTDILFTTSRAVITSRSASVDAVRIEGVIYTEIVGEKEDGLLTFVKIETPFSEEFGATDAKNGDTVFAKASVSVDENRDESENGVIWSASYSLDFNYAVYASGCVETVTDAFSATNELNLTYGQITICNHKCAVNTRERIEGSVTLKNDMPIVDSILASPAMKVGVTAVRAEDGEVVVDGIVSGNLIYYSAESNSKNSLAVELPFSVKTPVECAVLGDMVDADGAITAITLKIRRGNEIDIRVELCLDIEVKCECETTFVSAVSQGEERVIPTTAISVHIVGANETIWDASKALGATPEQIAQQNPTVELPLKGGERIIFYRRLLKAE